MGRIKLKDKNYLEQIPVRNPDFTWKENEQGTVTVDMVHRGFFPMLALDRPRSGPRPHRPPLPPGPSATHCRTWPVSPHGWTAPESWPGSEAVHRLPPCGFVYTGEFLHSTWVSDSFRLFFVPLVFVRGDAAFFPTGSSAAAFPISTTMLLAFTSIFISSPTSTI